MKHTSTQPAISELRPIWVVRAAKHSDAHSLFVNKGLVALEDQGLGNLSKLEADRETYYAAYEKLHPNESRVSISGIAGKFFRLAQEMHKGDTVLYPATKEKCVYAGKVSGMYRYDPTVSFEFPHQLAVKWYGTLAMSSLSQTAKQELGAARMLFQIKRHDKEIRRLLAALSPNGH
jgi:predicted Mrr-cat superfamily restriction endonuclease